MLVSVFALLPVSAAENNDNTEEEGVTKNSDVLWSLDFDDYGDYMAKNPSGTVNTYLESKGLFPNGCAGVITDQNKLKLTANQWFHNGADSGKKDDFRDLFYGLYTDEKGNALTEYYMEMDYTLVAPRETREYIFTGVDENNNTVTYSVYCPYRGESYFNAFASSNPYGIYFFKVSPTGYLYTPGTSVKDIKFTTADSGKNNIKYFTYTKKVGTEVVATKAPITEAIWNEMRTECGTAIDSSVGAGKVTFDKVHYSGNEFYQMEVGKEYSIRVKMSVESAKKVTATVYIRPAGSDEPFFKVGSTSYTYDSTSSWVTDGKDIRISENTHTYSLDNMKFVTLGACEGSHEFPVVTEAVVDRDGFDTLDKMSCLKCGAIYYENVATHKTIENFDLTKQSDYDLFKSGGTFHSVGGNPSPVFSAGKGIVFSRPSNYTPETQFGGELLVNLPRSEKNAEYRITYTATINKLPNDQVNNGVIPGSSFFTDRTGSSFNILLRMGKNAGYDETRNDNEGWLKVRSVSGSVDWKKNPVVYKIKEGETYKFSVVLKPSEALFDLYVNDVYITTGSMVTTKWTDGVKPYFRIANMMAIGMELKSYSFAVVEHQEGYELYKGSNGSFSLNTGTLNTVIGEDGKLISKNYIVPDTGSGTALYLNDSDIVMSNAPYTVSFDFMMTDTGEFNDALNTDASLWSLMSWTPRVSSEGKETQNYATMVRVGALDNDDTKKGFEKFFLVMNNNSGYYDKTDNGNQGFTLAAGGDISGYYSDKNSIFSFEAGEWITFTLSVNPATRSAYLYANGQLVGSTPASAYGEITQGDIISSKLRIGDSFRKLIYNWAIKNIEITSTPGVVAEVKDSDALFNVDFGGTYAFNSSHMPNLGNIHSSAINSITKIKDTDDAEGYSHFIANAPAYAMGATNLFNLSLTSDLGNGVYYNHVEGKKYAIETEFALFDRAPTDEEIKKNNEYNADTPLPSTLSKKGAALIRFSKYHDNNRISIIDHGETAITAITAGGSLMLYTKDDSGKLVKASAWYKESDLVDGKIPDNKWIKLKVVFDESDDTYSVYINDSIAYYKESNSYKRAENLKAKLTIGDNSFAKLYPNAPEMAAFNESGLYKDLPRTVTVDGVEKAYDYQGLEEMCYVRFFQNALDFSVRNISVTKIDDDLSFLGVQSRYTPDNPLAYDLRFIFITDDIYLDGIEYDVSAEVNGVSVDNVETLRCDTVYKTLKSNVGDINVWKFEEGEYFSTFNVTNIDLADKDTIYTFRITPYEVRYSDAVGKVGRDVSSATVTHIIKFNGKGELVDYSTENAAWADLTMKYTKIEDVPYKSLGRTQMLDGKLTADWSAAGIEFEATCVGDVILNLETNVSRNFTVVVDGVERKDVKLSNGVNYIATGLNYGKHSFKIMNQDGYSSAINIEGITLRGNFEAAPADSELFIEFIGDSITHGCGLASANYTSGVNDGTLTYAFLASKELGADYTIMANGGMGVKWGGDYDGVNLNRSMKKYPFLNDTMRGTLAYEGYKRPADLVVIGLSTNDNYRFLLQYNADRLEFRASNTSVTDEEVAAYMETWIANNPTADESKKATAELNYKAKNSLYTQEEVDAHSAEFTVSKLAELGLELEALIAEIEKNHGADVPIILARGMMEKPEGDPDRELYHTSVEYMTDLIENVWQGKYGDHVIKVAHLTPDRTGYEGHPTREGAAVQGADLAEFIRTEFPELVPAN